MLAALVQLQLYPSQTKILEGGTKDDIRIFEAFQGREYSIWSTNH